MSHRPEIMDRVSRGALATIEYCSYAMVIVFPFLPIAGIGWLVGHVVCVSTAPTKARAWMGATLGCYLAVAAWIAMVSMIRMLPRNPDFVRLYIAVGFTLAGIGSACFAVAASRCHGTLLATWKTASGRLLVTSLAMAVLVPLIMGLLVSAPQSRRLADSVSSSLVLILAAWIITYGLAARAARHPANEPTPFARPEMAEMAPAAGAAPPSDRLM